MDKGGSQSTTSLAHHIYSPAQGCDGVGLGLQARSFDLSGVHSPRGSASSVNPSCACLFAPPRTKKREPFFSCASFSPSKEKHLQEAVLQTRKQTQASCGSSLFEPARLVPIKVPFSGACQPGCLGWHSGVYLALVSFLSSSKKLPLISMLWTQVLGLECST